VRVFFSLVAALWMLEKRRFQVTQAEALVEGRWSVVA
jgi:hypothetical protein